MYDEKMHEREEAKTYMKIVSVSHSYFVAALLKSGQLPASPVLKSNNGRVLAKQFSEILSYKDIYLIVFIMVVSSRSLFLVHFGIMMFIGYGVYGLSSSRARHKSQV